VTFTKAVARELMLEAQAHQWDALERSIERAVNSAWSIEAEGDAVMALKLARAVGPLEGDETSWLLAGSGIYGRLLEIAGVEFAPSNAQWASWEKTMSKHNPEWTRERLTMRFLGTLHALRSSATVGNIREELGL
jgi:hypothetical protein